MRAPTVRREPLRKVRAEAGAGVEAIMLPQVLADSEVVAVAGAVVDPQAAADRRAVARVDRHRAEVGGELPQARPGSHTSAKLQVMLQQTNAVFGRRFFLGRVSFAASKHG